MSHFVKLTLIIVNGNLITFHLHVTRAKITEQSYLGATVIPSTSDFPLDPFEISIVILCNEERSLAAIADRLSVSPAAISQRIDRIESKIEHNIVSRRVRGHLSLTPAGHEVLRTCLNIRDEFRVMERKLAQVREQRLRIIADTSLLINDLPAVIKKMLVEMPALRVEMQQGAFSEIISAVLQHTADVGIIAGDPQVAGLQLKPFRNERIVLLVNNEHSLSRQKSVYLRDVLYYQMVLSANLEHIARIIKDTAVTHIGKLNDCIIAPNFEVQAALIAANNFGIAPIIESVAARFCRHYPVKAVQLLDDWADNTLSLVVRERGSLSDETNKLIQTVMQHYR